jgi:poly-gamma-glutamate synthesis protein (capsule biosynthesis protein)
MLRLLSFLLMIVSASQGPALAQGADIRMVFVGDVMLADGPGRLIRSGKDPFRHVAAALKDADITIGNLECVIASSGKPETKPYTFRAPKHSLRLLKKYFSAVSLANNHSGDFGKGAFSEMLQLLEQHQMPYFGGGRNLRAAHQAYIQEIHGKRIAVLGYNGFFPRSFEALDDTPGIAWLDEDMVVAAIQHTKQTLGADFLIVYPHWGWEYQKLASSRQRQMARLMIDAGADAVVGGHPHVTQDIEVYQGKPIFYSLGNFVFDGFSDRDTRTGWLLELTLKQVGGMSWRINEVSIDAKGVPRLSGRVEQTATSDPQ